MVKLPVFSGKRQRGQALVLILLVMSLVLTVILSSVSRSVTDVEISKYEDSSIRAFDAAQAGIEKAIVGQATSGTAVQLGNETSFTPVITSNTNTGNYYKYPLDLLSGESATISFIDFKEVNGDYVFTCPGNVCRSNVPTQMRICWGQPGISSASNETPAIYMEFYYTEDSVNTSKFEDMADLRDIKVVTASVDPNVSRRLGNHFVADNPSSGIPCAVTSAFTTLYQRGTSGSPLNIIDSTGGSLLFLKITMLYNISTPQPLGVRSASPLPSQGSIISSTGQAGDVYRKLVLFQGYPEIPFEIGNAIYSKGSLTK